MRRMIVGAFAISASLFMTSLNADQEYPDVTTEGLKKIRETSHSVVYAKDSVDLSVYQRIWLVDAAVAFKKNWQREHNRSFAHKVSAKGMEEIRTELADLFRERFTEKLTEAGYELVAEVGEDVLIVRPAIVNLDVTAPDSNRPGRTYQFAESAGEMTLYVELYDSGTQDLLVKALDRKADRKSSYLQWQTRSSNRQAAKRVLDTWAEALVEGLAEAKEAAGGSE